MVVGYKNNPDGIKCGGAKFTHVERPIHKLIIIQAIDENIDDGYENSLSWSYCIYRLTEDGTAYFECL